MLIKVISVILVTLSLFIDVKKDGDKKSNFIIILCCMMIFLTNGLAHVLTYLHQRSTLNKVNTSSFLLLAFTCKLAISGVVFAGVTYAAKRKNNTKMQSVCARGK